MFWCQYSVLFWSTEEAQLCLAYVLLSHLSRSLIKYYPVRTHLLRQPALNGSFETVQLRWATAQGSRVTLPNDSRYVLLARMPHGNEVHTHWYEHTSHMPHFVPWCGRVTIILVQNPFLASYGMCGDCHAPGRGPQHRSQMLVTQRRIQGSQGPPIGTCRDTNHAAMWRVFQQQHVQHDFHGLFTVENAISTTS